MTSFLLDCRWIGHAGVGRVTEYLLRGLQEIERQADWLLWGPAAASSLAPALKHVTDGTDPRLWAGQRGARSVPKSGDVVIFMHQTRPLAARRCITLIHDTTQLRTTGNTAVRGLRRTFLRRVARSSVGVITVSEWSRTTIARDLGLSPDRIRVVGNPADDAFGRRIRALRQEAPREPIILYVGSFAPHKNLRRLVQGFRLSRSYREGAELVLAGGRPDEARQLRDETPDQRIRIVERCPQRDLDALFARARLLVQPSIEEGFGLPVWEAMAAGIPVCASTGGALASVASEALELFDPLQVEDIAEAVDRAMSRACRKTIQDEAASAESFLASVPGPAEYAVAFERAALELLGLGHD